MNQKKNKHYQETDQKIQEALLSILDKNKVPTIAQICRICNINRTTFYLHYEDIVALLESQQKKMNQKLMDEFSQSPTTIELMSYESYLLFAKHIKANQNFYRFFFKVHTSFPLQIEYDVIWDTILLPYFHQLQIYDEEIIKLRFVCF
ncbi:MAG: TetR/AcrR family transcriptional regulator, partial [Traorella sp.]